MKVLVLGCGLQGKAAVYDLSKCKDVSKIVCVDLNINNIYEYSKFLDMKKIELRKLNIMKRMELIGLMKNVDIVIDLLPSKFLDYIADAAIEAGVNSVNTMYGYQISSHLHKKAIEKGVTIMPEAGLDPGIDLILCGHGVRQFDEVHELNSFCGGFPEEDAIDNPLKYKITWNWDGVLKSYKRPARILCNKRIIDIPVYEQFNVQNIEIVDFPGVGRLEAFPNGDAIIFAEYLGILPTLINTSRRAMRWSGHSEFWKKLIQLGFLDDEYVNGLDYKLTPHEFISKFLEPKLQYKHNERDMVVMRNIISGIKDGKNKTIIYEMLDYRDLETGFFAMNRTVGFTVSIIAQMIAKGTINNKGLLTAIKDVPYKEAIYELKKRGIKITESIIEE